MLLYPPAVTLIPRENKVLGGLEAALDHLDGVIVQGDGPGSS